MTRIGRILAWTAALMLGVPLLLAALILIAGNTGPGRRLIERLVPSLTGGEIHLAGLAGRFPDRLRAARLQLADKHGAYLTVDGLTFDWSPTRLLHGVLDIDRLDVQTADFARMPVSSGQSSSGLPVRVAVHDLRVGRLALGPAMAGHSVLLSATGAGALDSVTEGHATLAVRLLNGQGDYTLIGSAGVHRLEATITAREQSHGLISGLAGLPELGPVTIDARLDGPRNAVAASLTASGGKLRAHATGTLDLVRGAADLTVAATAPAMAPRPDIAWRDVSLDAHMQGPFTRPELSGHLRIDGLRVVGVGIGRLAADLAGDAGTARLHAALDGLTLPGQRPDLFAAAPVTIDATASLDAPGRPVAFTLRHPLLQAQGVVRTADGLAAHVSLTLPDLAPVAAAGGTDVQGRSALTLDVAREGTTTTLALRGTIGVTGGQRQARALLGDAARVDLAASLNGRDARLTRLRVTGRGVAVSAHGRLADARANLDWTAAITDLSALAPALTGRIDASGQVSGPENDLAAAAELHGTIGARGVESGPVTVSIAARGLPNRPSGTLTAQGALLNAPIDLALTASRDAGGIRLAVQRADWQSMHAEGTLTLPAGATIPQGTLRLRMMRLADLAPLLGRKLAGSIEAALDSGPAVARLTLTARGLALPGTAAVSRAALDATITGPQGDPSLQATLTAEGIAAGGISGAAAKLEAHGTQTALAVTLSASAPGLAGSPARVDAAATLDVAARSVTIGSLHAAWKRQTLRLLAPARLDFANGGAAVGHARLGLGQAVLAVNGRISPTLDLIASLRNLPAGIAAVASPGFAADGSIAAEARLTGSIARPEGTIRLTATGLRQRNGPGRALPAANLTAGATLNGTSARLDIRATAGASRLTLSGTAPLVAAGKLDLHAGGTLDLAMLDPILAAEGRRLRGQVTLDAIVAGTASAPRVTGTARLTGGDAQDYPLGVHVTDIDATLQADGDRLRLTRFSGRAGPGTLGGSGTIGLAAPMPVNLTFIAENARLVASNLLTATADSHLSVRGALEGNLAVAGTLTLRRAEIQVPDRLPASVAVLPVRNAGAPPPAPPAAAGPVPDIALDVTLIAQEAFIRGRGLDVTLGGTVHLDGTSAHPLPSGGLTLRRGTLSLVGQTLTFTAGSIDFTGAGITDPSIHLVATSSTNSIAATLTVDGSAKDPKITLSSVPQLPQDQILAQLLFQQSVGSLSPFQVAEIAAGLVQLSGATSGVGDPLGGLRNALGLDRLSVGSSSTGAPTLQAGRYLAPGVYIGASHAATGGGTQATVQIDIAKGLKAVTTAGSGAGSATGAASTGQGASVGLTYEFQY
ncbi:MAG TPA: translocation/assembly module TamB domain-containing protein [Acetobacteraceae bacterium]|nr:translocation/assembly module TamB domain-containing protein [Acetobacteraceae bacterium]